MENIYDMIIIGGGPAGYTAALYASRAGFNTVTVERMSPGGQMAITDIIDNYPGFEEGIDGFDLGIKMQRGAERFGAKTEYAEAGKMYEIAEKASLEIIAPLYDNYEELNNFSIVARYTHGENSFLFTGDAESLAELDILDNGLDIRADVLKIGHHGSAGASSKAFLDKVKPQIAVIEVGEVNDYGHPRAEVFERLGQVGCKEIYTTAADGNIVIVSDGAFLKVKTEKLENAAA